MLHRILLAAGIDFARLRDPWETPYRPTFTTVGDRDVLRINCAGADKRFGTEDDFVALEKGWSYFRAAGVAISRAVNAYVLAQYALAVGQPTEAARAREKLKLLAQEEAGTSYWAQESMTPFNGWGLAGRIESTAVAVQALAAGADRALVDRGLGYLLNHKDRYGVWHTTQATVNVLDALVASEKPGDAMTMPGGPAEIWVNEKRATTIHLPPGTALTSPLAVDLSLFLTGGRQKIEIKRLTKGIPALTQLITSHYQPWRKVSHPQKTRQLLFDVRFAKTTAVIGEEIVCAVEAGRNGRLDGGMLIAEVGLPPGAEVDRASLEAAKNLSGYIINHYEIQPDRVVFYLWPWNEMARFNFKFRPRYGLRAASAPSIIYDYYNPEARETRAPVRFEIR